MAYKQLKLWFDGELATQLADKILLVKPDFPRRSFVAAVEEQVPPLELKDRVEVIADELYRALGEAYLPGLDVLMQILGPENERETGMFTDFYWIMPIAKFVEKYGLEDFDISMRAIEEITKRNTGEYAIRPFIERHGDRTMAQMLAWSVHPNKHVRRLASEGGRPRLPWASKLDGMIDDPRPLIPILDNLKDDDSKYVRKSVANCLNDILKDNPTIGRDLIDRWNTPGIGPQRKWIIRHALRNLLKTGDVWAKEVTGRAT